MNLDELIEKIRKVSEEKEVQKLAGYLLNWKNDSRSAKELEYSIELFFGNSWIEKDEDYHKLYAMWSSFRDEAIIRIGGMTMPERLSRFCLLERMDVCKSPEEQQEIYDKLDEFYFGM